MPASPIPHDQAYMVHPISAERARPIRSRILRPNAPLELNIYPGDDSPAAYHAGAFLEGSLVGVASVFPQPPPFEARSSGWRLRGMAVLPEYQGAGIGRALVLACLEAIAQRGGELLWCNARTAVLPFYEKLGFRSHGEEFEVPISGPHYVMWREV